MITVRLPMPPMNGIGIRKPNNARLGMVCITLAKPSSQRRSPARRVSRIPSGTPISMATAIALSTSTRCSPVSCNRSFNRSGRIGLSPGYLRRPALLRSSRCETLAGRRPAPAGRARVGRSAYPGAGLRVRRGSRRSKSSASFGASPKTDAVVRHASPDRARRRARRRAIARGPRRARAPRPPAAVVLRKAGAGSGAILFWR